MYNEVCKQHKYYSMIREPDSSCNDCWKTYLYVNLTCFNWENSSVEALDESLAYVADTIISAINK